MKTLRDIELYHKINPDVKDDYDVLYAELRDAARENLHNEPNHLLNEEGTRFIAGCHANQRCEKCKFILDFFSLEEQS